MKLARARTVLCAMVATLALIGVMVVLYRRMAGADLQRHALAVDVLQRARQWDWQMQHELLALRTGLSPEYDRLSQLEQQLELGTASVTTLATPEEHDPEGELTHALSQLAEVERSRRMDIERFKSENAILRNSLHYLPTLCETVDHELSSSRDLATTELRRLIQAAVESTLASRLVPDEAVRQRGERQRFALRNAAKTLRAPERADIENLLGHAAVLDRQGQRVERVLLRVLNPDYQLAIGGVEALYEKQFEQSVARAKNYRTALYAWSLISLLALAFAAHRLWRNYRDLERLVRQRTQHLDQALVELWGEMALARKIQLALVPSHPSMQGHELAGYMAPAEQVGGDYYDVIESNDSTWLLIGDVAGHGISAGLVMMMCRTAVRTALCAKPTLTAVELLAAVNSVLTESITRLGENKHMTLTAVRHDNDGTFTAAGMHQDLLIFRHDARQIEQLSIGGPWLGLVENVAPLLESVTFTLAPGDCLLLYTDGVTEASKQGDMFELSGLRQTLLELGEGGSSELVSGIVRALEGYAIDDDVTLLAIRSVAPQITTKHALDRAS